MSQVHFFSGHLAMLLSAVLNVRNKARLLSDALYWYVPCLAWFLHVCCDEKGFVSRS
jgi:hypothetical protein